ncbi:cutinase-domain-containing protein [Aspergillus recurvatus]
MKIAVVLTVVAGVLGAPTPTLWGDGAADAEGSAGLSGSADLSGSVGVEGSAGLGGLSGASGSVGVSGSGDVEGSGDAEGSASGVGSWGSFLGKTRRQFYGGSSTSNDVTDNTGCKDLTFIFARGTSEMGNMGTVVGPKVSQALNSLTGNRVATQGVDYPADSAGNTNMGGSGGPKMASLVETALKQCPDTKVVLGGYSQGAMVVHNAAGRLSSGQVVGAVTFGDPFKAQKPSNIDQFKTFCASGDPVCLNGNNFMAHLSYGNDAQAAAQFLVSAAGL